MFRHLSKFVCTGITKLSANTWLAFTFARDRVAELTDGSQWKTLAWKTLV